MQRRLYRQAKSKPTWKAWSLYGEVCRQEILEAALWQVIGYFDSIPHAELLRLVKLSGVQLPQIQHPTLQHSLATYPQTLTERIINMMLAILENAGGHPRMSRVRSLGQILVEGRGRHPLKAVTEE